MPSVENRCASVQPYALVDDSQVAEPAARAKPRKTSRGALGASIMPTRTEVALL
jgi:hypothetical protein